MAVSIDNLIGYSLRSMLHSKMRTGLTLMAIVIGVSMLIVLFGLSGGMKLNVNKKLSTFGPNTIVVTPTNVQSASVMASMMPTMGKLFDSDFNKVRMVEGIDTAMKIIRGRANIVYQNSEITSNIVGVTPDKVKDVLPSLQIEKGRFLNSGDMYVVVIGNKLAKTGFDKEVQIGSILGIENKSFRVVGILKAMGQDMLQTDNSIFIPDRATRDLLSYQLTEGEISGILIKAKENYDVESVGDHISQVLELAHHVSDDDKDFSLITPKSMNEKIDSVLGVITTFVGLISVIALMIGAVGTANTIYMGVLERTREIGTLLAVGMTSKDIIGIFIFESALLGVLGGAIGLIIGYILLYIFSIFGVLVSMDIYIGLLGFVVSIIIAMVAGYFPAVKAGKLSPVVALRYE